jgi:hypothetical protein
MMMRSGPISFAQRCTREGGIGAAPCWKKARLDRSRSSAPGASAIRCSMVGVAVNVVTRCRSISSSASLASNFSITTSRSPASRFCSVTNAFTWYIGARTRTVWGRATGIHASAIGVL